ncbi:hypothetical protein JOE54_002025 [Brachybacterium tyrofermentans]
MTNEKQQPGGEPSGQDLVEQLKASGGGVKFSV